MDEKLRGPSVQIEYECADKINASPIEIFTLAYQNHQIA